MSQTRAWSPASVRIWVQALRIWRSFFDSPLTSMLSELWSSGEWRGWEVRKCRAGSTGCQACLGERGVVTLAALRADRVDLKRGLFRWGQDPELTVKARTQ